MKDLIKRERYPLRRILFDHEFERLPVFEKEWINFACLSHSDIKAISRSLEQFQFLSHLQCICKDWLVLQNMNIVKFLDTKQPCDSFWELRLSPKELYKVHGLPFYGCREPVKSSTEKPFNGQLVSRLRYIYDVLHVKTFIVFEARNFRNEAKAWDLVCPVKAAELVEIPDWRTPSTDVLVRFIEILQQAVDKKEDVLGHCIAGNGRTGMCLLFALMLQHEEFNIVKLLKLLADKYKKRSALEVVTIVQSPNGHVSIYELYRRFQQAFSILQKRLPNHDFFIGLRGTFPHYSHLNSTFSSSQLRTLRDFGLKSRG